MLKCLHYLFDILGASLVSIEDPAEMNFLLLYLSPFASDNRKFWIGLFRNIEGNYFIMALKGYGVNCLCVACEHLNLTSSHLNIPVCLKSENRVFCSDNLFNQMINSTCNVLDLVD